MVDSAAPGIRREANLGKLKKRRKSRWGDQTVDLSLPKDLPAAVAQAGIESYMIHMRIEDINRKLRLGTVIPPAHLRAPSPEPIYDQTGKRLNTREARYRKKLEEEREELVEEALRINPDFRAPTDYKKATKQAEKLYIPADDYPDINFIGLLIGPRGNTLKKMESETGAKISIRGKGSAKEGKFQTQQPGHDEDLHCYVTGESEDSVAKAIKIINKIIEQAVGTPAGDSELKKIQLRELALLNGTLKEEDAVVCTNCGGIGHRKFECTERKNILSSIICQICGGAGHATKDCLHKDNPQMIQESKKRIDQMNSDYHNLMAELGDLKKNKPDTSHESELTETTHPSLHSNASIPYSNLAYDPNAYPSYPPFDPSGMQAPVMMPPPGMPMPGMMPPPGMPMPGMMPPPGMMMPGMMPPMMPMSQDMQHFSMNYDPNITQPPYDLPENAQSPPDASAPWLKKQ